MLAYAAMGLLAWMTGRIVRHVPGWSQFKGYDKKRRRLQFSLAGHYHDMSVTDSQFDRRFKLPASVSHWPSMPETLPVRLGASHQGHPAIPLRPHVRRESWNATAAWSSNTSNAHWGNLDIKHIV